MKANKKIENWYIKVNGIEVSVSKEVYVEYRNSQSKERMQNTRRSRCMVSNGKGGMRLCPKSDCCECPHKKTGTILSLDRLYEDYEYEAMDENENIIELINKKEREQAVNKAVNELSKTDALIAMLILAHDKSESYVAKKIGISQSAVHQRKVKIIAVLQEKLKDYK